MPATDRALASGTRVPIAFADEEGVSCLFVPLDDEGAHFALIECEDFDHIVLTLGCRAAWYLGGTRGRRQYIRVNVPHVDGRIGGHFTVVRLLPGVGPGRRVCYATPDTLDLRRRNLIIETVQDGRSLDATRVMGEAVSKKRAATKQE